MAAGLDGPLWRLTLRWTHAFVSHEGGGIVIKFALALPVLLTAIASVIDHAWLLNRKDILQGATDAAAMAGAKELSMADSTRENVAAVVEAMVQRYISDNGEALVSHAGRGAAAAPVVRTNVSGDPLLVEVEATLAVEPILGGAFGITPAPLSARSVARIAGQPNICVLALDPSANRAISLEHQALVTGNNCAVFSNSLHRTAIIAKNSASLRASFICSRGGRDGGPGNFNPLPMTDCPGFEDPLAGRPEPSFGPCVATDRVVSGGSLTLWPGTYCGGLEITDGADVTLMPGEYVMRDGPLKVDDDGRITGKGVGFYLTGDDAEIQFANDSHISLEAPTTGLMAGILFFESRSQPPISTHELMSNDAPVLVGTVYLPRGELKVDADAPIASESAYTAIIARVMRLYGGPHLVLNTNYQRTDVPVPDGIRGTGEPVSLVE